MLMKKGSRILALTYSTKHGIKSSLPNDKPSTQPLRWGFFVPIISKYTRETTWPGFLNTFWTTSTGSGFASPRMHHVTHSIVTWPWSSTSGSVIQSTGDWTINELTTSTLRGAFFVLIMVRYTTLLPSMRRLAKFKGSWVWFYHQFKTGRIDQSRMETLIAGPPATSYRSMSILNDFWTTPQTGTPNPQTGVFSCIIKEWRGMGIP